MIDNFDKLALLISEQFDGDTFYYTELLDRTQRSGNNKNRRLLTYTHRTRQDLFDQRAQIIKLCESTGARAYFRVTPRSFKSVGSAFVRHIVEQSLTGNFEGMRHGYSSIAGRTPGKPKRWLFDIDTSTVTPLETAIKDLEQYLFTVPTPKGRHLITEPFDVRRVGLMPGQVDVPGMFTSIHRDNPTILYAP